MNIYILEMKETKKQDPKLQKISLLTGIKKICFSLLKLP